MDSSRLSAETELILMSLEKTYFMTVTETLLISLLDSAVSRITHGSVVSRLRLTDEGLGPCQRFVARTAPMILSSYEVMKGFVILRSFPTFFSKQLLFVLFCGRAADEPALHISTLFESSLRALKLKFLGILI